MGKRTFNETLARLKEDEQPDAVLLVAGDQDYVSIVGAWARCGVRAKHRMTRNTGASDADTWKRLWHSICSSKHALREASGVPANRFEAKLNALIANRVLYPDRSVNSFVRRYLRERVLRILGVDARTRRSLRVRAAAPASQS